MDLNVYKKDLREQGFCVVQALQTRDWCEEMCALVTEQAAKNIGPMQNVMATDMVTNARSSIVFEALANEPVLKLTASVCRGDPLVSSVSGLVSNIEVPRSEPHIDFNTDQTDGEVVIPDDYHIATVIWACTPFSKERGSTGVVPGTHKLRQVPPSTDVELTPIECEPGSAIVLDGMVWHGNHPILLQDYLRVGLRIVYISRGLEQAEDFGSKLETTGNEKVDHLLGLDLIDFI